MTALLLNHLWQSSLCAGGAALIALALRRNSATVRFWVWFAASLKFLVPFAALTALGAYALTPMVPAVAVPTVTHIEPFAKPFSTPAAIQITASLSEPSELAVHSPPPALAEMPAKPVAPAHAALPMHRAPAARSALPAFPAFHFNLESVLLVLWAAGFLALAIRWLVRWWRLRALLRDAVEAQVDAPIAVRLSASRLEPGLVGILHPVILLPQGIEQQLSPAELKAVLAHELCHWRRHDNLLTAIHMLVEALFWFFPLVWWVGARLNAERECACDESVLAGGNDPQIYAEGILKVCRAYLQSPLACVAGVSGGGLKRRIRTITENKLILQLTTARKFILSATAAAVLALPLALGFMVAPITRMQAKAAPLPSQIATAQRNAEQAPPDALKTASTALPANHVAERSAAGQSLQTNQTTMSAVEAPSPDLSRLVSSEPVAKPAPVASNEPPITSTQHASKPSPAAVLARNDQAGASNSAQPVPAKAVVDTLPGLLNSLPMELVPGSDIMTVAATIDGHPKKLLVGIADTTQLWNAQARKLDLPVREGRRMMDGGGRFSDQVAQVAKFTLGSMETGYFDIQVSRDPDFANPASDGVLGTDMMMRYDIDLDFAHNRLNYFAPDQCDGGCIYWAPNKITSVQMVAYGRVVYVPVMLDGHKIIAALDTTADRTFLNPKIARRLFGLRADSLKAGTVRDSGALIKVGKHIFSSLTFGGLTINNPQLAIPFDVLTQNTHEFHANRLIANRYPLSEFLPPMVIGMDVLKQSHLYISFQNQRIYVSAAGDGPALNPPPIKTSWFNVWKYGYDDYLPYLHKHFGL